LQRTIADVPRRQTALLRQAQDISDSDDPWVAGLRASYNDLDAEKTAALAAVADLDGAVSTGVGPVGFQNSATPVDQWFHAAASYSLISPPRIGWRLIRVLEGSVAGESGRGGCRCRARCGRWWL
jgi:hypothetical protein